MNKILTFCFVAVSLMSTAQSWNWAQSPLPEISMGKSIAVDTSGFIYVAYDAYSDYYNSSAIPCSQTRGVLAKHNPAGQVIWTRSLGGQVATITRCSSSHVFVAGHFANSAVFCDGNNNTFPLSAVGPQDAYIACYDLNGTLLWAKNFGSPNLYSTILAISTIPSGEVIAAFETGPAMGYPSATLMQFNISGQVVQQWGPQFNFGIKSMDTDALGNTFFTTTINDSLVIGNLTLTPKGTHDACVAKLNAQLKLLWIKQEGNNYVNPEEIRVDNAGSYYLAGRFLGPCIIGSSTISSSGAGGFIARFDTSGQCQWVQPSNTHGITVDADGSGCYFGAWMRTQQCQVGSYSLTTNKINRDFFVARYNTNGQVLWVTKPSGPNGDCTQILSLATDHKGNCYQTGSFTDTSYFGQYAIGPPQQTVLHYGFVSKIGGPLTETGIISEKRQSVIDFTKPFDR